MADDSPQKYNPNRPIDLFDDDYQRRTPEEQSELSEHDRAESDRAPHPEAQSPVDQELAAIKRIAEALGDLTQRERERVLRWAVSRFAR